MQRLIDANNLPITPIDITDLPKDKCLMVYYEEDVNNAETVLTLPDNPTNGDVCRANFDTMTCNYILSTMGINWWNAPYKRMESEGNIDGK